MVVLLVTAGYDQNIRLWDASSGMSYKTLQHADKQARGGHGEGGREWGLG
jgi:WD40 repeat protein